MMFRLVLAAVAAFALSQSATITPGQDLPEPGKPLTDAQVSGLGRLALQGLPKEYPNKPSHVMVGAQSVLSPKQLHPAFYGCFDWHSSVHGHWMLVRLLKIHPDCSLASQMRSQLGRHLTLEHLRAEATYFEAREHRSFERMYGWAWALRLAAELHTWDDRDGRMWRSNLKPLEARIVGLTRDYLPRLSHPIRTGVHPNTAFALGQTLDYARIVGDKELERLVIRRARDFYLHDRDYPVNYEPSGEDFFSPALNEADLMRRILEKRDFAQWLSRFMPALSRKERLSVLVPVDVTDVTDGKLVHLAGLDLSRAWALRGIVSALPADDDRVEHLSDSAAAHARKGYGYVFSGHYEGEHWLATFAVYAHTGVGLPQR